MSEEKARKKLVGRWEWILIVIALLVLLTIVLQKFGVHVVNKTDNTEMIDRPHQ